MEKLLTSHQVAKLLNVWPHTLRRWEREGKLKPLRTPGGHRRYKESQIMALIGEDITENEAKHCAVYARVSTAKQADAGNLQRQKERLIAYAVEKGYQDKAVYTEIASGLNENRRELAKLAKVATKGEIEIIVIEYKDRLARFGYKYLILPVMRRLHRHYGIKRREITPRRTGRRYDCHSDSYSARIYGKRGWIVAKKLTELIEQEVVAGEDHG